MAHQQSITGLTLSRWQFNLSIDTGVHFKYFCLPSNDVFCNIQYIQILDTGKHYGEKRNSHKYGESMQTQRLKLILLLSSAAHRIISQAYIELSLNRDYNDEALFGWVGFIQIMTLKFQMRSRNTNNLTKHFWAKLFLVIIKFLPFFFV